MRTAERRTFVGFGLGAIQAGLFLYGAQASGWFQRLVAAEVVPDMVRQVREDQGYLFVNIAHRDHIEVAQVGPIEVLNPAEETDRAKLVEAVREAQEIATAVPGVSFYRNSDGPQAISRILAAGLMAKVQQGGPRAVVYAAENHNHAAEILQQLVLEDIPAPEIQGQVLSSVCFLNTVIGKMSGVVSDAQEIAEHHLTPMTPGISRAFLVEAFNHILISRIHFEEPGFSRGIETFIEKDDLLPFEEAKLYGHNATHALGAYVGRHLGARRIADLPRIPGMLDFMRKAFIEESGGALIHRYQGIDPLFTVEGYTEYADDLLDRMVNPNLSDTVERVGRDIERKLAWDDRLVGTLRCALSEGIRPVRYALGAAAALAVLDPASLDQPDRLHQAFFRLWGDRMEDPQAGPVLEMVRAAFSRLRAWKQGGDSRPESLFHQV